MRNVVCWGISWDIASSIFTRQGSCFKAEYDLTYVSELVQRDLCCCRTVGVIQLRGIWMRITGINCLLFCVANWVIHCISMYGCHVHVEGNT
jgi:hypothetical protein